jgi:hypothetical protein
MSCLGLRNHKDSISAVSVTCWSHSGDPLRNLFASLKYDELVTNTVGFLLPVTYSLPKRGEVRDKFRTRVTK